MTSTPAIEGAKPLDSTAFVSEIVCAYVSNNAIPVADLPKLIAQVQGALNVQAIAGPAGPAQPSAAEIRKSITHEALISFEDGKPYKTLRRHLTLRGLSPEAYRAKWGLDANYPMTSAAYSAQRSELARSLGLGQQRRKS
jgi:predicted transcriptional regulator